MEPRVHIITLAVADLPAARAFYERLGWKASAASQETIAFFQLGDLVLALYPRQDLADDVGVDSKGDGFQGFTLAHNVPQKDQVAAILDLAEQAGGRIVKPARDVAWGGHSGYFADPDGHFWEVAWNPFFPFSPSGSLCLP